MTGSSVSRCVAVAAHGKRCQQTPFRGSPYCWHHTQSRKGWAPSRTRVVTTVSRPPRAPSPPVEAAAALPVVGGPDPAPEANLSAIVTLLARLMDPRDFAELVHFLTAVEDGSLMMSKREGELVDLRL